MRHIIPYGKMYESITKKVYRGGDTLGSKDYGYATFYTDDEKAALEYAREMHGNETVTSWTITFNNPLVLVKDEIGEGGLMEIFTDIFGAGRELDVYMFPFGMSDNHRNMIIEYAKKNRHDGIVMDDTDVANRKIIKSYVAVHKIHDRKKDI